MFIKAKLKMIRKLDLDVWLLTYYRRRKTKFFTYFKISMLTKIYSFYQKQFFVFDKKSHVLKDNVRLFGNKFYRKKMSVHFADNFSNNLLNTNTFVQKKINFFRLFQYKRLPKVKAIFFKYYFKYLKFKYADAIFVLKNAFKLYRKKNEKLFTQIKKYVKLIILYYNKLSIKKLKKWGRLMKKSKMYAINFFITRLEFRVESLVMRLNLGSKFWCYNYIKAKQIVISGETINFGSHVVKLNDFINFKNHEYIYRIMKDRLRLKSFFAQPPFYMEINYRTLTVFLISKFLKTDAIPFPFVFIHSKIIAGLHTFLWGW